MGGHYMPPPPPPDGVILRPPSSARVNSRGCTARWVLRFVSSVHSRPTDRLTDEQLVAPALGHGADAVVCQDLFLL